MFIFRLYDYEAVSELCSFAAFFCLRSGVSIKYEDYEKQTNFLRNTRMVMING